MTQIGNAYAQALYSLAKEENSTEAILQELEALDTAFRAEPAFLRLLSAPNVSKQERCAVLDSSFRGRISPYVLNFMKILTEKGYIRQFSDCCRGYREQYNNDHGILPVRATTAIPLTQEQSKKLTDKLEKLTGKNVQLSNRVDPDCLGGVSLDYDGMRVDGTVKSRLDAVRSVLKNTVL